MRGVTHPLGLFRTKAAPPGPKRAVRCRRGLLTLFILCGVLCGLPVRGAAGDKSTASVAEEFFETAVRPILVEHCQRCHGPKTQWANLRLDSRTALIAGGESGAAVVPGKPAESELIRRIAAKDDSLRMPPADEGARLTDAQVAALTRWVELGAPWPDAPVSLSAERERAWREHWAFQPVRRPVPPDVQDETWARTAVDRFILARLAAQRLGPSPEADRRTLIRRATYDLTGLPPTPEAVEAFLADDSPDAYARLIDRLLDSPHYGERWGRHWLDVARYSDTKGYVYAREERHFVHASAYRDWVVRAFNEDMPYDRFLLLQLAADQAAPDQPRALAAMGLLTLGRRFLGVTPDIIDDRIDVVTRGLMGLTVSCARCHDHKYDPIPTADYYSLYGVFENCVERLVPIPRSVGAPAPSPEFQAELEARRRKLADATAAHARAASERVRQRLADYLMAQRELDEYPVQGFGQILSKEDLIPAIVRNWETYLARAAGRRDPVFVPWSAFAELSELSDDEFPAAALGVTRRLGTLDASAVNPRLAAAFAEPPSSPREVAERYAQVFAEIDRQWQSLCESATRKNRPLPESLPDPDDEALRQVLYGPSSPCVIPDEPIVNTESLFDSGTVKELWQLQNEVDRWLLPEPVRAPHAVVLTDREHTVDPRIFRRGNPADKGEVVPRQFLGVIAGADRRPFSQGSGRLEMARAITAADNPLTARVWVNRVWMHHFGAGLVRTPSDFGLRADPPSHPELLDWLASELTANGWSTKHLHRTIMLSATYRQGSGARGQRSGVRSQASGDVRSPLATTHHSPLTTHSDPENRLLWRMNARRLGYEGFRDTLLAVSGELDRTMGGKAVEPFPSGPFPSGPAPLRRSIYGLIDRQFLPSVLRLFDFANPDLHTPQRPETTVPQQALFALNHPFVAGRARALAEQLDARRADSAGERVARLYRTVFQREPSAAETSAALAFIEAAQAEAAERQESAAPAVAEDPARPTAKRLGPWEQLAQVLLVSNELMFID